MGTDSESDMGGETIWIGAQSASLLLGVSRQTCYRLANSGGVGVRHTDDNRLEFRAQDLVQNIPLDLTEEAWKLLALSDAGDPAAMRELGLFLLSKGMESSAFGWFLQAAEKKDADAMERVSRCYLKGIGATVNVALGVRWLGEAAIAGNKRAQAKIEALNQGGTLA